MNQNRMRDDDMPNRSSNMEPAEGSRETIKNSSGDLGTSSDRAMFDDRLSDNSEGDQSNDSSSERGSGRSERGRSNSGGITNRPLEQEQSEQDQLPPRGRSQWDSDSDSQSERCDDRAQHRQDGAACGRAA